MYALGYPYGAPNHAHGVGYDGRWSDKSPDDKIFK